MKSEIIDKEIDQMVEFERNLNYKIEKWGTRIIMGGGFFVGGVYGLSTYQDSVPAAFVGGVGISLAGIVGTYFLRRNLLKKRNDIEKNVRNDYLNKD